MRFLSKDHRVVLSIVLVWASVPGVNGFGGTLQVKQSPEVIEAYRLCQTFEHLLGQDLDFDRAYEATFPQNKALRRAIAIADGEFGNQDLASVDDDLIINAYKRRMQIFYLTLVLAGPSDAESAIFFPPEIKELLKREPPADPKDFGAYVAQLDRDVARFRSHLDRLSTRYSSVADRVHQFKSDLLAPKPEPPKNQKVEPITGYYRSGVLTTDQPYYQIGSYTVVKEQGKMRIIGIRFFTRLF
jgi:hypothetical protein